MKRPLTIAAAGLLVAVNAWVLLGVARNRLGAPDATLTLSERELTVHRSFMQENSAVEVSLEVNGWQPGTPTERRWSWAAWLPARRLAELGFDLDLPLSLQEAHRKAGRQPSRRGWAVLQLGGAPRQRWEEAVRREAAELDARIATEPKASWLRDQRRELERELQGGTRLFMVDAGADAAALRAAYPDRSAFLVLPAEIHLEVVSAPDTTVCAPERCKPAGRVSLLAGVLQVPRHLQPFLPKDPPPRGAGEEDPPRPTFIAVLRAGARREPWLESVQP